MRRILLLALLLSALIPGVSHAAIAFVSSVSAGSPDTNTFTTGALNSTGANLIVCGLTQNSGVAQAVITDSKSNTYSTLTVYTQGAITASIVYAIAPTVGASHTFTATQAGAVASLGCLAFSGAATASPADVGNGSSSASGTSQATGSIAAATGAVAVTVLNASNGSSPLISDSFILQESVLLAGGAHYPMALAYKLDPGTVNPTWSWTTSTGNVKAIQSFLLTALAVVAPSLGWMEVDE